MNIKEAIDSIKGCVYVAAIEYNTTEEEDDYDEEALAIAIEAMKKQEPMKVTSPRGTYPNEYGVTMYEYDCPNCGVTIEFESLRCYEPEYCDECGQKLDWED